MSKQDSEFRGRLLSRKEMLALMGGAALSLAARPAFALDSGCVARPELTEGPFFVDEHLNRSDIRLDPSDGSLREGAQLTINFNVTRLTKNGCEPFKDAVVDVWHCDAAGNYSDVDGNGPDGGTRGKKFLRGYQVCDAGGLARFTTIYPGGYRGRAVHVHFKIRAPHGADKALEFTSQLFFSEPQNDEIFALPAYAAASKNRTRNADDGIYKEAGKELLIDLKKSGGVYSGEFNIALHAPA